MRRVLAGAERPVQPRVNTSRLIPGRAGTRGNRCPKGPPQRITKSMSPGALPHTAENPVSRSISLARYAARRPKQGTRRISPVPRRPSGNGASAGRECRPSSPRRGAPQHVSDRYCPKRTGIATRTGPKRRPQSKSNVPSLAPHTLPTRDGITRDHDPVDSVLIPEIPAGSRSQTDGVGEANAEGQASATRSALFSPPAPYKGRTPRPNGPGVSLAESTSQGDPAGTQRVSSRSRCTCRTDPPRTFRW